MQGEDKHLSGLAYDSREAKAGDLFFCLVGLKQDGHSFAPDAY
ncbi:MAG TPA: Mur ligase domain-containing protein, partial [Bacillota bacterium]|nr:Mur ligase domain-containing protein [Bacillota bacterium]